MKAEHKAILTTVVIILAVLAILSKFADQDQCDMFGLTSHKG